MSTRFMHELNVYMHEMSHVLNKNRSTERKPKREKKRSWIKYREWYRKENSSNRQKKPFT